MLYQLSYASPNSVFFCPLRAQLQNAPQCSRRVRRSRNFSIATALNQWPLPHRFLVPTQQLTYFPPETSKISDMIAYLRFSPRLSGPYRKKPMRLLILFSLLVFPFSASAQQHTTDAPTLTDGPQAAPPATAPTMSNDSVVRMVKAGLSDDLVIQTINTQPGKYTTDADSLVALKNAGLSDRIISAMMNKSRRQITNVTEKSVELSDVNEIGVYYKDRSGKWIAIEPEIVHIKSGGWLKSTATHGIIKEDHNGHLNGRESKLALQAPIDILIYVPEGVSASEYDFLRFRINSDNREFRVLTGGVFHSTGGADRDEVKFNPVKTAPHTYQFTVDQKVGGGEYGILPPGTGNVTNGGKIYTFAITE
jgi:hypothetical protein